MTVRKSLWIPLSALTAGGTLLFGMMLSSHSQSIDKPDTPLKVAMVLDCITQPRFQDDLKQFGLERLVPTAGGHLGAGQLSLPTQKDRDLFKTAENAHRDFLIGFVHCAHVPGSRSGSGFGGPGAMGSGKSLVKPASGQPAEDAAFSEPLPRISPVCNRMRHLNATEAASAGAVERKFYPEMSKAVQKSMPLLRKGKGAEQDIGDYLVVTRPVRAMKTTCLKCHEGAKMGDTLGGMVYLVSKQTFAAVLPSAPAQRGPADQGGF